MLVLTRKCDETIKIGNDIIIKVIHTGRGTVKLGIEAPSSVRVLRGELIEFPATSTTNPSDSLQGVSSKSMTMTTLSVMTTHKLAHNFDAEYVAELEDQLLVATAS